MRNKCLTALLLGVGLLAYLPAAEGISTVVGPRPIAPGGVDGTGNPPAPVAVAAPGGNSGPKTYAIVIGSDVPSNGVANAVRGDLDADHVAAQ